MTSLFAGRYSLLQKLAKGGMAEVFLARAHGIEGFEKLVVLKRILPNHADDPNFVRMFLDEARTAADLNHPNVVTVFDAGVADGTYFITMEYLRGTDVGALFDDVQTHGPLPVGIALHVLIDAARGLHAAHTARSFEGRALGIVHRDISPQNLFVTSDGVTKVLDFGIAHAATRSTKTEVGVVKGKIAYLSPEQLEGLTLDGRSDQFALGIVAWELLAGRRLFQRPSDAEVLRAVLEVKVPRLTTVPESLEHLVLRMLAARRDDRFPDCEAAADALEAWLDAVPEPHSAGRVARAMKQRFTAPPAPKPEPTRPGVNPPPNREAPTRPERKRAPLPHEDDFLAAVSVFLQQRPTPPRSNLVPPPAPFIGRERDLAAVRASLADGARLVTVVGFGGLGKTRLVSELAWREREAWANHGGAWFCDLADARSADDVCKAVARALEVEVPLDALSDSITQTGRTLRSLGPALVVLDNFEQVVDAAAQTVGRWLELAPAVRFLVTSRESLRLPAEVVYPLAPLATSGGSSSEAVQLFVARARLAGRPPSDAELATIATICQRLEGHALAIELAAANLPTLTPQQIAERLDERFTLLGGRVVAGRHATLWATIDWSWQLLTEPERAALSQLAVFRGGFTPESAIAVMDLTTFQLAPPRLEVLAALHRKSLLTHFVAPEAPDVLRLRMLESVHQFASEQLEARPDELARARRRHADHLLALGQHSLAGLGTAASEQAMGELFAERENLSEVFERALSTLPPTPASARTALRALQVLEPVMVRTGPYASHLALLDEALRVARAVGVDPATLAIGLQQRGNAWRVRGRLDQALGDLEQALTLARGTPDSGLVARIACDLAVSKFVSGAVDAALAGFEEAHALASAAADSATVIETLAYLAIARTARHDSAQAIAHCDEALPIARARGDRLNEARLLGTMGSIFQDQGRLELASAFLREAVQRCRTIKEVRLQGYFLGKLAHLLLDRGELATARARLNEALALLAEVGDLRHEGLFLSYVATLDAVEGQHESAHVTLGSARSRLESVRDPLLLTALALRTMEVELRAALATPTDAAALLERVRARAPGLPSPADQSEEIRLAAQRLEHALASRHA